MGIIPQVVDTVIFIKDGEIRQVLSLEFNVKVPHGMVEADLARPVIEVKDFETGREEYEIYSFGEEVMVMQVKKGGKKSGQKRLAEEMIAHEIKQYSRNHEIEMVNETSVIVRVPEHAIAGLIGREGCEIKALEERLGLKIKVLPLEAKEKLISYYLRKAGGRVELELGAEHAGEMVNIYADDELLLSAMVGRKGTVSAKTDSMQGKKLLGSRAIDVKTAPG
jgi:ATPase